MKIKSLGIWMVITFCVLSASYSQTVKEVMNANAKVYELVNTYVANADLTEDYDYKIDAFRRLFDNMSVPVFMDHIQQAKGFDNIEKQVQVVGYEGLFMQLQESLEENSFQIDVHSIQPKFIQNGVAIYEVRLTKHYRVSHLTVPVSCMLLMTVACPLSGGSGAVITNIRCLEASPMLKNEVAQNVKPAIQEKPAPETKPQTEKVEADKEQRMKEEEKAKEEKAKEEKVKEEKKKEEKAKEEKVKEEKAKEEKKKEEKVKEEKKKEEKVSKSESFLAIRTEKNAIGVEVGYNHPVFTANNQLPGNIEGQFEGVRYAAHQFPIGLTYSRQVFARGRHRVSVETGLSITFCRQRIQFDQYQNNRPDVDVDGTPYTLVSRITDYNELSRQTAFTVPLALRYDLDVLTKLSLFASLGIQGGVAFSRPVTSSYNAYYAGQYGPDLFNVYIDQNGYYGFGTFEGSSTHEPAKKLSALFGATFSLGVNYLVSDQCSVEAAAVLPYYFLQQKPVDMVYPVPLQSLNMQLNKPAFAPGFRIRVQYHF